MATTANNLDNSKVSENVRSLLQQMTWEEKATILSGADFVMMAGIPRLNIPALKVCQTPFQRSNKLPSTQ